MLKSSLKIGTIAGIGIYMHFTFLIFLGWVAMSHYFQRQRWQDALVGLAFMLALFLIIVLHEFGHALTAKHFGIRTRDITLLPIGGVARLEQIPEEPKQELLVALAGPAVNLVLAGLLFAVVVLTTGFSDTGERGMFSLVGGNPLVKFMWINISLAIFNLIPAFPMDGGRVLRAVLATVMDYTRATGIAARIGRGLAWVFGLIGLFSNPFLILIALFIWIGAAQEAGAVQMKSALSGLPVGSVMITQFRTLGPEDTLQHAVEHILSGCQQDFPVVQDSRLVGILTRADLIAGLAKNGAAANVAEAMHRNVSKLTPSEPVEKFWRQLQETDCRTLPVMRSGELVGILTAENLGEYLMIQAALKGASLSFPSPLSS